MICQNCKKKEATVYYKKTVNNQTTEYRLCSDCASKLEENGEIDFSLPFENDTFHSPFSPFENNIFSLPIFGVMTGAVSEEKRCKGCGMTRSQIEKYGFVGCPECYETFEKELMPAIERMHGAAGGKESMHKGKVPSKLFEKFSKKNKLENLREKLKEAIDKQEFEKAAEYRDMIRALENEKEEGTEKGA